MFPYSRVPEPSLTGRNRRRSVSSPPSGRSNRIESLRRVEGTTASAGIRPALIGVCREASGLQVLLENGIEDEKASAGCPPDDRESSLDRP